jgi:signal peptidase I
MKGLFKFLFWLVLILSLAYVVGWAFLFEAATAEDNGMAPNIIRGDEYLVYLYGGLDLGTPVVCADPRDESKRVTGRIVGAPGDLVKVSSGGLYINNTQAEHTVEGEYVLVDETVTGAPQTVTYQDRIETLGMIRYHILIPDSPLHFRTRNTREIEVAEDSFFLLSDNRAFGEDSRTYGLVKISSCIGRPLLVYRPAEVSGDAGSGSRWFSIIR